MNQTVARVLPASDYSWHTYKGPARVLHAKNGREIRLEPGHKIGVRPANSDPNKVRLIHEHLGPTHVFSMSKYLATRLTHSSEPTVEHVAQLNKKHPIIVEPKKKRGRPINHEKRAIMAMNKAFEHAKQAAQHPAEQHEHLQQAHHYWKQYLKHLFAHHRRAK